MEPTMLMELTCQERSDRIAGNVKGRNDENSRHGGRVAAQAGAMISALTLAIINNLLLVRLAEIVHCYSTQAEAVQQIALEFARTRTTVATTIT
jgi:hypothetical protein